MIKPPIYSSFKEGNDRSQPLKKIDSNEYFPLATLTVTNQAEREANKPLYNISGLGLDSLINVSIKGQTLEFVPLKADRTDIGFVDFRDIQENDKNKDAVTFPTALRSYQNLQIKNPITGRSEPSPFYFGYVGALEGGPKSVTKDQLLVLGKKNRANLDDGETKTYTLYGRLFAVDKPDSIKITSISEDTGKKGDFITNDNTLIFQGTAEARSKVEVFLNNKSIGIAYANDQGKWLHNYSQFNLPGGKYELKAEETNLFGQVETTIPQPLKIANYNIDLDFTDPSIAGKQKLQKKIKEAANYWEGIILNDIPDVEDPAVGGFVDDLKITFKIVEDSIFEWLSTDIFGSEEDLAWTNTIPKGKNPEKPEEYIRLREPDPLTGQPTDYLPYHTFIYLRSEYFSDEIIGTYELDTLKHEIAHAIGFNSETFDKKKLIKKDIGENKYGFTGTNALDAYHALGGKATHSSVPLEDDKGLTPSHWNELLFPDSTENPRDNPNLFTTDELMTKSPPVGEEDIFLSKLTLRAFQDLGFTVELDKGADTPVYPGRWGEDPQSNPLFKPNPLFKIDY